MTRHDISPWHDDEALFSTLSALSSVNDSLSHRNRGPVEFSLCSLATIHRRLKLFLQWLLMCK